MSTPARRRHRFLFAIAAREADKLLDRCEEEDIQCLIDLRSPRPGEERAFGALDVGASSRLIYYAQLPELVSAGGGGDISRQQAWVARTALRHRTCLITRGRASELVVAAEIAALVGLRLVDLDEPAPATNGSRIDDPAAAG